MPRRSPRQRDPQQPDAERPGDLRIGTDIARPAEIARSIAAFGDRYLDRVFTATERRESGDDPQRLAARFAAKEAVVKVLRPRPDEPIDLADIAIVHDDRGAPTVQLSGTAAAIAHRQRLGRVAVSIAHEHDLAVGTAVSRTGNPGGVGALLVRLSAWTRTMPRTTSRTTPRP